MYQTDNEGSQHAPMFRTTVVVDGASYTSPNIFSHLKTAEQDVTRIALLSMPQKIKDEEYPLIQEDSVFCKSILNEYAAKLHVEKPIYKTEELEGLLPVFVSSVVFNGKLYVGKKGRNKRESQQLAARAVILSSLDSESGTVIAEIIKSKSKLYVALDKLKNSCNTQNSGVPVGIQAGSNLVITESKGNEFEVVAVNNSMPRTALPEPCTGNSTNISATHTPLHEFRPPKAETSSAFEAITTPIIFVPPTSEQLVVGSTSGKKRKRKNNKANKKVGVDAQLQVTVVSSGQPSPCSVAR